MSIFLKNLARNSNENTHKARDYGGINFLSASYFTLDGETTLDDAVSLAATLGERGKLLMSELMKMKEAAAKLSVEEELACVILSVNYSNTGGIFNLHERVNLLN